MRVQAVTVSMLGGYSDIQSDAQAVLTRLP
jgi:hypothetical protein